MSDVQVTIGGNAQGAVSAANQAAQALQAAAQALQRLTQAAAGSASAQQQAAAGTAQVASQTNSYATRLTQLRGQLQTTQAQQRGTTSALQQATSALQQATTRTQLLADITRTVGAAQAQAAASYLRAATSSQDYAQRLAYLQAQLANVQAQQSLATASAQRFAGQAGAGGAASAAAAFLSDGLAKLGGAALNFVTNTASMLTALIGFNGFSDAAQKVKELANAIFDLNVQTERNTFMWQYQFASSGKRDPQIARSIAAWSAKFSYDAPFTRQDIMSGIGALAPMGLNLAGIQRFAPLISDLAATHTSIFGGGQLTFSQVSLALMEAMTAGNARRMLMELQLRPRELEKYGVKFAGEGELGGQILNPEQFLPALEALSKDRGWTGAAKAAARETWWGTWSSFIDRMQNLGLQLGGTDLTTGTVRKGSMFAMLKGDLNDLNSWIDAHQGQLVAFADLWGQRIGGAIGVARDALSQFMDGLNSSGFDNALVRLGILPAPATQAAPGKRGPATQTAPTRAGRPISRGQMRAADRLERDNAPDPSPWQRLGEFASKAADALGDVLDTARQTWDWLQQIGNDFLNSGLGQFLTQENRTVLKDFGDALGRLGRAITPQQREDLERAFKAIGGLLEVTGTEGMLTGIRVLTLLVDVLTGLVTLADRVETAQKKFEKWLMRLGNDIGRWFSDLDARWRNAGSAWIAQLIAGLEEKIPGLKAAIDAIGNLFPQAGSGGGAAPNGQGNWGNGTPIRGGAGGGPPGRQAAVIGQRPNGGYAPLYALGPQTVRITVNASGKQEVLDLIDAVLARRDRWTGAAARTPGGFRMFGGIGGF